MLLAEDPATLIHHTINNFNIQPDKQAAGRVRESLSTLQQARELRVRDAEAALRRLARQLQAATARHDEAVAAARAAAADHASRIAALDTRKFRTAKAAAAAAAVDDEVLLRLKVYRSLGIDIERDERDGEWTRAVVRNDRKGDVHVINMDKKFSRFFYANYFWQTL